MVLTRITLASLALAGVVAVGCSSSPNGPADTPSGGSTKPSAPASSVQTTVPPAKAGEYTYENAGVSATFKYTPGGGELQVTNKTGATIPAPGIYMLDARDGHRVAGTVEGSVPVPNGQSKTFQVKFATALEPANVGFVLLLIGHSNYGGMVPPK